MIIIRSKENQMQILYDDWNIESRGKWYSSADRPDGYLPREFDTYKSATTEMHYWLETEPGWKYEISEYLR